MTDDDVPLDLVLHTPGGLVLAALQIARAIREHKGKVTVFVPHYAMSGKTLISRTRPDRPAAWTVAGGVAYQSDGAKADRGDR